MTWRALDLFCGAGGSTKGLQRAGFHVTGVDIEPQPNYVGDAFIQADALEVPLDGYDLIWASPPCQVHTQLSVRWRGKGTKADTHTDLIGDMRDRLSANGTPWIIENVQGAVHVMRNPLRLHGGYFGLGVYRMRLFETWPMLLAPPKARRPARAVGVYGRVPDGRWTARNAKGELTNFAASSLEEAQQAMGIDWMTWDEIREAIPPAYSEHLGRQMSRILERQAGPARGAR